jgi:histidinol-phosphate/aromatic aminotransferase/cobyric acid decarboxylase-like protein
LIFLALRHWLTPQSRVLLLDPTYGEYAHVLEQVVRCRVERFPLAPENDFQVNLERLEECFARPFDLAILVNPNSPTGQHVPRAQLERLLRRVPSRTRVWVDETYIEYAGAGESLERFAAATSNVVVCKSMSKVYALSGARVAYLCAAARTIADLRAITPPWAVGLPAQVAAVRALQDPDYYARRYAQTHQMREQLAASLADFAGWRIVPGIANFLLCHLPATGPTAAELVVKCRTHGLFLRDAGAMGARLGRHTLRIAVKDSEASHRMLAILKEALNPSNAPANSRPVPAVLSSPPATLMAV